MDPGGDAWRRPRPRSADAATGAAHHRAQGAWAFRWRLQQHFYLLRSVEAPLPEELPPRVELITARGPFALDDERRLLKTHGIDVVVTKNSGGTATAAKLEAARALALPVIMVRRPELPDAPSVATVEEALAWLERHHGVTSSA